MSTLYTFSCLIGRAMNLPPVFFRRMPYISILDQGISLGNLIQKKRKVKRLHRSRGSSEKMNHGEERSSQVVLEGSITEGKETRYAIEGVDFSVSAGTWIIGEPQVGGKARVKGIRNNENNSVIASSIVVIGV
jgi:hypothetical protein